MKAVGFIICDVPLSSLKAEHQLYSSLEDFCIRGCLLVLQILRGPGILSDYTMKPKTTVAAQQLNKKFQVFFNVIILSHVNDMHG